MTVPPLRKLLIRRESSYGRALRRCLSVPHAESRANATLLRGRGHKTGSVGAYNKTLNPTAADYHTEPATQIAQRVRRHWSLSLPPASDVHTRFSVVVRPCRVNMLVACLLAAYSMSRGLACRLPFLAVSLWPGWGVWQGRQAFGEQRYGGRTKPRSPRAHKC
jgi:hypothetical protein